MANVNIIERRAIRAVEEYVDKCTKLESIININDKTSAFDGDILVYYDEKLHNITSFLSRIPVIIKGTSMPLINNITLEIQNIQDFKSKGGGLFFLVQMTENETKLYFSLMSVKFAEELLNYNKNTIDLIDLKDITNNHKLFEQELIDYVEKNKNINEDEELDSKYLLTLLEDYKQLCETFPSIEMKENPFLSKLDNNKPLKVKHASILIQDIQDILKKTHDNKNTFSSYNLLLSLSTNFASFLQEQKRYDLAERYFKEAINYAHLLSNYNGKKTNEELDKLTDLYKYTNDLKSIEEIYLDQIKINLDACETDPINNVETLAAIYLKLANYYEDNNKHSKAEKNYVNALNLYYLLVEINENKYHRFIINILWDIYELHKNLRKNNEAKQDYEDEVLFIKNLDKDNKSNKRNQGKLLAESAYLYKHDKDYQNAKDKYIQSLKIYSELGDKKEEARVSALFADLLVETGDHNEANNYFNKSITFYKDQDIKMYEIIASKANALSIMSESKNYIDGVVENGIEELKIDDSFPISCQSLTDYLETIFSLICYSKNYSDSIPLFISAIDSISKLAKIDTEGSITIMNSFFFLTKDLNNYFLKSKNNETIINKVAILYETIMNNYTKLEKDIQINYTEDITFILKNLIDFYFIFNKYQEVENKYKELINISREIANIQPKYNKIIASSLRDLGRLYYINLKRYDDAKSCYLEALAIVQRLAEDYNNQYTEETANLFCDLGNLARADNRKKDAENAFKEALELYNKLIVENHEKYSPQVAEIYENIAYLLRDDNTRIDDAKEAANKAYHYYKSNIIYEGKAKRLSYLIKRLEDQQRNSHLLSNESNVLYTVWDYLNKIAKYETIISDNNKTPIIDGYFNIYNNEQQKIEDFFAQIPVVVKASSSDKDYFYMIEREDIDAFKILGGIVFFKVLKTENPNIILYSILSIDRIKELLKLPKETIRIDLEKVPSDTKVFEKMIFDFATKRNTERIMSQVPREIASFVKNFEEIRGYLEEIEDKKAKRELKSCLDSINKLKEDGTGVWSDKFIYYSRKALELATNNLKGHDFTILYHDLGRFLHKQKQNHLVEDYYLKALEGYIIRADKNNVAGTYNNLALLYKDLGRLDEAEEVYLKALKYYYELADSNHNAYIGDVAETLNNLAAIHMTLNRNEEAEDEYQETMEIYRELAESNREAYITKVVEALNNLGALHRKHARYKDAEQEYLEALEIYRELAKSNYDANIVNVAETLNNLAAIHAKLNRIEEAEDEYHETLKIYHELAESNPEAYITKVVEALNNLGALHRKHARYKDAEQEYLEALEIYRELAKSNYDANIVNVAETLNNLAAIHAKLDRNVEAEDEYHETLEIYHELAESNPEAYITKVAEVLNNLGNLHSKHARYKDAVQEYHEALEIYRELAKSNYDANIVNVAETLNNLAAIHAKLDRNVEAEDEYHETLEIYHELAESNPEAYITKVAEVLNNLGNLHSKHARNKDAEQEYHEALEIYRELAESNRDAYIDNLIGIHNNLAILYINLNRKENAVQEYQEVLKYYQKLVETNREAYIAKKARAHNNLAALLDNLKRYNDAEKEYKKALKTYRELAETNRDAYIDNLVGIHNNLAILYKNLDRKEDAVQEYQEALKYYQKLVETNREAYIADKAKAHNNLAALLDNLKRYNDAEKEYKKALKTYREIAETNRDAYIDNLVGIHNNLAILYKNLDRKEDAVQEYQEALKYYQKLVETNREAYIADKAKAHNNLAALLDNLKRKNEAKKEYEEALKIRRELAEKNSDAYLGDLAETLNNLGNLYNNLERYVEAKEKYEKALEIRRELAEKNPDAYLGDLAETLNNLGDLYKNLKPYGEAEKEYKDALKIYRELAKTNRDAYIGYVAKTLNNLGLLHQNLTRNAEAEKEYKEALEIYRELDKTNRDAYLQPLVRIHDNLAVLYQNLDRKDDAVQEYQEALKIYCQLTSKNRDAYKDNIAIAKYNLAKLIGNDNRDEAIQLFQDARDRFMNLRNDNPGQQWERYINECRRMIIKLSKSE